MMLPSLRAAFITLLSLIPAKAFQAIPKMREVPSSVSLENLGLYSRRRRVSKKHLLAIRSPKMAKKICISSHYSSPSSKPD